MKKLLILFVVLSFSNLAQAQTWMGGGRGGIGTTPLYSSGVMVWDDFSGNYTANTYRQKVFVNTNYSGIYSTVFISGANTNFFLVSGGQAAIVGAGSRAPVYLGFSNRISGTYFNAAAMTFRTTNNPASSDGNTTIPTILLSPNTQYAAGDWIHAYYNQPYIIIQRGIAETLLLESVKDVNAYIGGHPVPFGVATVSNTIVAWIGNEVFSCTHSNAHIFGNQPMVSFELNGADTDDYITTMEDFWAGYADPLMSLMLARSQYGSGTNGMLVEKLANITFASGSSSYTNRGSDTVLVMGVGNANPSGGRTNYLYDWGANQPGATITVLDNGLAVGTNIWFMTMGSRTITNTTFGSGVMLINRNYGKATLRWTGNTWMIDSLVN